ncbi:hypothetical protein GCM10028810_28740 [Spirosoma litoris]
MSKECLIILRLLFEKQEQGKNVGMTRLIHLIDRHHWDDFVHQREMIENSISRLTQQGYLDFKDVQEPDGKTWTAYRVTAKGEKHLSDASFT